MHTHIWDMPEKERIKAENQKGNKQQTREKCSMNAHSHILPRHGQKKTNERRPNWMQQNCIESNWCCVLYVWDAVGWSMQVNIRSRRDLIVCRLFRHFWYVPSTKILAHFVAFMQWTAATTTTGCIQSKTNHFQEITAFLVEINFERGKNVFDFDGTKRRAFGEFELNQIQWKYPFAITFIYYCS